ncbi:amino acid ABC transporter permease [Pseudomonas panipatensis]|uniref:amino acid ABC transporter permease n=1 Tax=Pseudomonas panipatensis TaxID=428992 RepID=UPI0035AFE24F
MARTKRPTWPWHGLTALIILVIGVGIWYSTSLISYEWRWNRVPQYFAYQAEEAQRAESLSRVAKIEQNGREARVTLVAEDGRQQELKVAGDSLQFSENDDVSEGDVVGVQRHWTAGPLAWGLWTTLWISFVSGALGLAIGLFTGLCRLSKNPTLHDLSTLYVELVRGTPLLVQIFIFYFFIGTVLNLSREFAGVAALALFTGAYVAEIIRSGVQSIARGQDEAARSLGLNAGQSMRYVILPQAFKRVLPPLAGQFISLVKDTSLVSVIAITELTKSGREAITTSFSTFEIWFCVAALYLVINLPLSHLASRLERRLGQSD